MQSGTLCVLCYRRRDDAERRGGIPTEVRGNEGGIDVTISIRSVASVVMGSFVTGVMGSFVAAVARSHGPPWNAVRDAPRPLLWRAGRRRASGRHSQEDRGNEGDSWLCINVRPLGLEASGLRVLVSGVRIYSFPRSPVGMQFWTLCVLCYRGRAAAERRGGIPPVVRGNEGASSLGISSLIDFRVRPDRARGLRLKSTRFGFRIDSFPRSPWECSPGRSASSAIAVGTTPSVTGEMGSDVLRRDQIGRHNLNRIRRFRRYGIVRYGRYGIVRTGRFRHRLDRRARLGGRGLGCPGCLLLVARQTGPAHFLHGVEPAKRRMERPIVPHLVTQAPGPGRGVIDPGGFERQARVRGVP